MLTIAGMYIMVPPRSSFSASELINITGNGCQKAFYDDPNILYISLHVHMDGKFYPSGQDGAMDKVGVGAGTGKNVNIPWPTKGMGDGDYMYAFQHVVMPIATEFDPDLVIGMYSESWF